MTALIVIGVLLIGFIVFLSKPKKAPEETNPAHKQIQENINNYFGDRLCRQVKVDPIGFIFDPLENNNGRFIVSAKITLDNDIKFYTVLMDNMSTTSAFEASDYIITKITQDIARLPISRK